MSNHTNERITEGINNAVDNTASDILKMIAGTLITSRSDTPIGYYELTHEINRAQGAYPGHVFQRQESGYPIDKCKDTLIPCGLIQITSRPVTNNRDSPTALAGTEAAQEFGLPVWGAFLDWELCYPDTNLRLLLSKASGGTGSTKNANTNRLRLYQHILDSSEQCSNATAVAEALGTNLAFASRIFRELGALGVLEYANSRHDYRSLRLFDTPLHAGVRIRPDYDLIDKALYAFFTERFIRGEQACTASQLIGMIQQRYPGFTSSDIRETLRRRRKAWQRFLDAETSEGHPNSRRKPVTFAESYVVAIGDLVSRYTGLLTTPAVRDTWRDRALEIIGSAFDVAELMEKDNLPPNQFPHHTKKLDAIISGVIGQDGPIPIREVQRRIMEKTGKNLSQGRIRAIAMQSAGLDFGLRTDETRYVGHVAQSGAMSGDTPKKNLTPSARRTHLDPRWYERANCRDDNNALFFPQDSESIPPACTACSVTTECLNASRTDGSRTYGIRGGLSSRKRERYFNSVPPPVILELLGTRTAE